MGYSILTDKEKNFEVMHNFLNQKEKVKHHIVKLPCHGASIELLESQPDTNLICPDCGKRYLFTHSAVSNKLYGE